MKECGCWVLATVIGLSLTGCMAPNGTPNYTGTGILSGAASGALLGSTARDHGRGALVGAAAGAVIGGLIGNSMDQAQQAQLEAQSPQTLRRIEQGDPLTVLDVKALVNAGIKDDLILSQIRNSRTVYHLSTADIIDLKNSGASDELIDYMINTPTQTQTQTQSATVAVESSRVPPAPRYDPKYASPGPGYVWVGGSWFWAHDHWNWRKGSWKRPVRSRR